MDPLTAALTTATALANMIATIVQADAAARAQMTPEQQAKYWDGRLQDQEVWRALWAPLTKAILKHAND